MTHSPRCKTLWAGVFVSILAASGPAAWADITRDAANRLCVDVVVVERGRDVRGVIVSRTADGGATLAVRRGWLRTAQPEIYEEFRTTELEELNAGTQQLIERIDAWMAELDAEEDRQLLGVLTNERENAESRNAEPEDGNDNEFVLLEFTADRIREIHAQPPRRRQAGLCAYQFNLTDVEETNLIEIESELGELDPNWPAITTDLTDRLASRGTQSPEEWAARQALFDYQFGKMISFQGTGDVVVKVDPTGQGDVGEVLSQVLGGGLTVDLNDLLEVPELGGSAESNAWRDRAIEQTEAAGARGCRVTRVAPDLTTRTSTVDDVFLAKMPDGSWATIWTASITATPGDVPEGVVDRIREDPQVEQIITTAEALGVGAVELNQALSFGGATMHAQSQADGKFQEFITRYVSRLDGPPLQWQVPTE
jgi:hypothetical protein